MAYWEIKENDGEEWMERHFVLRPRLISKLCAVSTQFDVSQMGSKFCGLELGQAMLIRVNEFSPEHIIKICDSNYETILC